MNCLILVTVILLNAPVNILIKAGIQGSGHATLTILVNERGLSATVLRGISCFAFALVAYTMMTSARFAIIGLVSLFVLEESVTLTQIVGFRLIVAGIWLVPQTGKSGLLRVKGFKEKSNLTVHKLR